VATTANTQARNSRQPVLVGACTVATVSLAVTEG